MCAVSVRVCVNVCVFLLCDLSARGWCVEGGEIFGWRTAATNNCHNKNRRNNERTRPTLLSSFSILFYFSVFFCSLSVFDVSCALLSSFIRKQIAIPTNLPPSWGPECLCMFVGF